MRKQGVALKGKFLCGDKAASGNSTKVGEILYLFKSIYLGSNYRY